MAKAAYASELPFYAPTGPIVSGPLFEKASDVPPSSTAANKPAYASELPFYVPTGRIVSGPLFTEVYEEDVPPITTANNPPPPSTTPETDPLSYRSLLPPEPLSSSSSYSPYGIYPIDVHPLIEAYNNMPDYPYKPPKGFDCPYVPPEIAIPGILKPVKVEQLKGLEDMADLALKHYNDQNNTSYQFVKVIKANMSWDGGSTYNITFQAKDDTTCSPPRNFQARVTKFMDNTKVLFCRVEQVSKPPGGLQGRDIAATAM